MSMGNDDHLLLETSDNDKKETKRKPSFSYTIEFLLSLSDLDACKKLPRGFDPSTLSEFEDTSNNVRDRQKVSVDSFVHRSRHGEFSASPPTRSEGLTGFSRGSHVRWDNRSSGSNDRDGDFQSERESFAQDAGKRTGNNSWRSSSNPEQDGLLGSGSGAFSKPSLYAGGASKVRASGSYQLNKSSEPYQPPRPYKALPYTRRDASDSLNDETFGSSEVSSDDRVEEERRRRASFELMRKEHQKAHEEKQTSVIVRSKDNFGTDITTLNEKTEEVMDSLSSKSNREENQMMQSIMQGEPEKYPSHANVSRPLVPPGFASTIFEKNHNAKTSTTFSASEVVNNRFEENDKQCKDKSVIHNHTYNKQYGEKLDMVHSNEQQRVVQNIGIPSVSMDGVSKCLSQSVEGSLLFHTSSNNISNPPQARNNHAKDMDQIIDNQEVDKTSLPRIIAKDSSSILDKLFGTTPTVNVDASVINIDTPQLSVEDRDTDEDNSWPSIPSHSSKFVPWFLEEEEKEVDKYQSTKPKDMFSLFASDDNKSPMLTNSPQIIASKDDFSEKVTAFPIAFSKERPPEEISHTIKTNASLGMLTCEDLEQSILAEMNEMNCGSQVLPGSWSNFDKHSEEQKAGVDNRASQHLLSLLQKVPALKEVASVPSSNSSSVTNHIVSSTSDIENPGDATSIHTSVKTLTLETLFGTAFMKELHSTSAPVSVQKKTLSGSAQTNLLNSNDSVDSLFRSTNSDDFLSSNLKSSVESSHPSMNPCKIQKHWLDLNDAILDNNVESMVEIQLPEEKNLITMGDSAISRTSFVSSGNDTRAGILFPSESDVEITGKLAALNSVPKGERRLPSLDAQFNPHHPYGSLEPDILNSPLLVPPSSLQMPTNFPRPKISPLDLEHHHLHQNPQMRLIKPDNIHHDVHNHPFPTSVIQHPFYGLTEPRFDPVNQVSLHQMNMLRNFPSPQSYEGIPREFLHPINDVRSHTRDLPRMHDVLLNPRPSNYAGIEAGMPVSGISGGSVMNHPDALKKLMGIYNPAANIGMRYK